MQNFIFILKIARKRHDILEASFYLQQHYFVDHQSPEIQWLMATNFRDQGVK